MFWENIFSARYNKYQNSIQQQNIQTNKQNRTATLHLKTITFRQLTTFSSAQNINLMADVL